MNISLDFDDTITRDEIAWRHFCEYFISRGHNVYIYSIVGDGISNKEK